MIGPPRGARSSPFCVSAGLPGRRAGEGALTNSPRCARLLALLWTDSTEQPICPWRAQVRSRRCRARKTGKAARKGSLCPRRSSLQHPGAREMSHQDVPRVRRDPSKDAAVRFQGGSFHLFISVFKTKASMEHLSAKVAH